MDGTISTFIFYKTLSIDIFYVLGVEIMTKIEEIDAVVGLVQGVDLSVDHDLHQRGTLFFSFDTTVTYFTESNCDLQRVLFSL